MQTLKISQLAKAAGVGIDTIRYYERSGLLPEPARRSSGYRDYPLQMVERLRFIRRAKALGFSLEEITQLLALSDQRTDTAAIKQLAQARLADLDHRLAELQRVRDALHQLTDACPGHGASSACPILGALCGDEHD
jgi:MerR family copper efflux transcriptional regulator